VLIGGLRKEREKMQKVYPLSEYKKEEEKKEWRKEE